jgi:hypothetical protein
MPLMPMALGVFVFVEAHMSDKCFKTYREQREILESRGLFIPHPRTFGNIMLREGYYNVINGYKKHFLTATLPERYIAGTTFEQLYALYTFDQELRALFMPALMKIEKHVKALLAYHFSESYGHDDKVYMSLSNFNDSTARNRKRAAALIRRFNDDLLYYERRGNNAICHYRSVHGYVPLWVANGILSFGAIQHFYASMKLSDQQNISRYFGLSASDLNGFLGFLKAFRNICAHGGRIYTSNYSATQYGLWLKFIPDTQYHVILCLPQNASGNFIYGKSDVLALLIAFRIFLKKSDFIQMRKVFQQKYRALRKLIPVAIMASIDREMGYPDDMLLEL